MSLGRPLRQDDRAIVKFKYTPNGRAANMLSLNVGDEVVILSRDSESQGWWKGRIGDRVSGAVLGSGPAMAGVWGTTSKYVRVCVWGGYMVFEVNHQLGNKIQSVVVCCT